MDSLHQNSSSGRHLNTIQLRHRGKYDHTYCQVWGGSACRPERSATTGRFKKHHSGKSSANLCPKRTSTSNTKNANTCSEKTCYIVQGTALLCRSLPAAVEPAKASRRASLVKSAVPNFYGVHIGDFFIRCRLDGVSAT